MAHESLNGPAANARRILPGFSILTLIGVVAVLMAMMCIQNFRVPSPVEAVVGRCAGLGGLLAVPLLLTLAFKDWHSTWRSKLPPWRIGLTLSSMVLASLVWMSPFALSFFHAHVDPLSMFATLLCSNLLAGLFAIALRGNSRLLVTSAVLLLCRAWR